jgi:hypothetical protein
MKQIRVFLAAAALAASGAAMAAEESWQPVDKSITALLNEGWVIRHYAQTSDGFDETFILEKDGRYTRCEAATTYTAPNTLHSSFFASIPQKHVTSTCEALN